MGKSTAMTKFEESMLADAKQFQEQVASIGGASFFSTKGGILKINDTPLPHNEMAVVILDSVLENVFYPRKYDQDNLESPTCYAFGRDDSEMGPIEDDVIEAQNATCQGCPQNKWGSADTGKGKACRNRARLAVIQAGEFDKNGEFVPFDDVQELASSQLALLNIPPTSLRLWGNYVKSLPRGRPPYGVYTRIWVEPDDKYQFTVNFEVVETVGGEDGGIIVGRLEEARSQIITKYSNSGDSDDGGEKKPKSRSKPRKSSGGRRPAPKSSGSTRRRSRGESAKSKSTSTRKAAPKKSGTSRRGGTRRTSNKY